MNTHQVFPTLKQLFGIEEAEVNERVEDEGVQDAEQDELDEDKGLAPEGLIASSVSPFNMYCLKSSSLVSSARAQEC